MANVTTLPEFLQPMMGKPSICRVRCAVCGRTDPLEQHHIVRRGAGKMFDTDGVELEKPTVTLCGFGNHGADADGKPYCHGLAHANRLHFRWADRWEYILLDEPTDYLTALELDGWRYL